MARLKALHNLLETADSVRDSCDDGDKFFGHPLGKHAFNVEQRSGKGIADDSMGYKPKTSKTQLK